MLQNHWPFWPPCGAGTCYQFVLLTVTLQADVRQELPVPLQDALRHAPGEGRVRREAMTCGCSVGNDLPRFGNEPRDSLKGNRRGMFFSLFFRGIPTHSPQDECFW